MVVSHTQYRNQTTKAGTSLLRVPGSIFSPTGSGGYFFSDNRSSAAAVMFQLSLTHSSLAASEFILTLRTKISLYLLCIVYHEPYYLQNGSISGGVRHIIHTVISSATAISPHN